MQSPQYKVDNTTQVFEGLGIDVRRGTTEDLKYQFFYRVARGDKKGVGTLIIILAHPFDNRIPSDSLVSKLALNFLRTSGYQEVILLYLWPFVTKDPRAFMRLKQSWEYLSTNDEVIKEMMFSRGMANTDDWEPYKVILAWGELGDLKSRGLEIASMVKALGVPMYYHHLAKNNQPSSSQLLFNRTQKGWLQDLKRYYP